MESHNLVQLFAQEANKQIAGAEIEFLTRKDGIRISVKTNDDPTRASKKFTPINLIVHEDFSGSTFSESEDSAIGKELSAFIKDSLSNFKPQTTSHRDILHTEVTWVFPKQC